MRKTKSAVPALPPARKIETGDYSIAYFTLGPEGGRPLVLCHGLAAHGLQFVRDAKFFARRGFRVIVPDLRGHGRSTCPDVRTDADFSIARMAADLIGILDAEGIDETDWVGNSLGGILAVSLMGSDRNRLKKFISFGTAYALDVPAFVIPLAKAGHGLVGAEMLARIGAPATCRGKAAQAIIYAMLREMDVDAITRIARHVGKYDLTANGASFDGPVLMIRGARDKAVNGALEPTLTAMEGRDNFQLVDITAAGHCANLDQPKKVRMAILDFLGDTGVSG